MNKNLPLILIALAILLVGVFFATRSEQRLPVIEEQTQQEAAQEVEQTETPEDAGELIIEKTDQEFSGTSETDFSADGLSDESLEL